MRLKSNSKSDTKNTGMILQIIGGSRINKICKKLYLRNVALETLN